MALRKFAATLPVIATLALAAPVATAGAQTPTQSPGAGIPCYPYPAFCGPGGKPWFPLQLPLFPFPHFGPLVTPTGAGTV
jgi:hypothetical protein